MLWPNFTLKCPCSHPSVSVANRTLKTCDEFFKCSLCVAHQSFVIRSIHRWGEPVTFTCSEFRNGGGLCVSPNGGCCPRCLHLQLPEVFLCQCGWLTCGDDGWLRSPDWTCDVLLTWSQSASLGAYLSLFFNSVVYFCAEVKLFIQRDSVWTHLV